MKSTLKFNLIIALLALVCSINAQTYRLEIGYNNPQRFGTGASTTFFNGVKLGGTAEFKLKNNFSLLTGVLYNCVYSNKLQGYPSDETVRYKTIGHFLDVPARLTYTLPLSKSLKVFGFAGPNLNIGLYQKRVVTSSLDPTYDYYVKSEISNLYSGSSSLQLNRLNLQVGLGGGVQWKKYQLKATYDFGINNLNKNSSDDSYSLHQKGWYFSVAVDI